MRNDTILCHFIDTHTLHIYRAGVVQCWCVNCANHMQCCRLWYCFCFCCTYRLFRSAINKTIQFLWLQFLPFLFVSARSVEFDMSCVGDVTYAVALKKSW